MNKNNPVLKNAQKLGRDQQKSVMGGAPISTARRCCEWDDTGKCYIWTCDRCQCP
ncbi:MULTISPECIES: hypothetical protein [Chryseobacterium]|uniref:hypothetical protein n=1 Tax=Chryseobacterium TaxID=59732 RepID=UPI00129AE8F5|nr:MULTISPECIES: hypothetical protein [Chryseobacterium]UKB79183.1 hypothetical protein LF886_22605 [Chryseobacterium sp. MEBOG07]